MKHGVEVELCWDITYSYREATFEKLLAQTGSSVEFISRGNTTVGSSMCRSVVFATRLTLNAIRNLHATLRDTYVLEYVDVRWDPPHEIWQLRDWLQEHHFYGASRWIDDVVELVSSRLQP
jgi:hypothetical protein